MAIYTIRKRDLATGSETLLTATICNGDRTALEVLAAQLNRYEGSAARFAYDVSAVQRESTPRSVLTW
ncbi:MAG TPA: hypothetical protein VNJ51_13060 [Candidatus Dormibacteraeota bacterium]|nr:hypothetical protein [Candidatus Dormibacteraeota bacterium]